MRRVEITLPDDTLMCCQATTTTLDVIRGMIGRAWSSVGGALLLDMQGRGSPGIHTIGCCPLHAVFIDETGVVVHTTPMPSGRVFDTMFRDYRWVWETPPGNPLGLSVGDRVSINYK